MATIYYLNDPAVAALSVFERLRPKLEKAGVDPIAWFVSETAPNNFPRQPVRGGEHVLVWFSAFSNEPDHAAHERGFEIASRSLAPFLKREPETLRLLPTSRSQLRGGPKRP